jgi:tagaturonate reductase
MRNNIILQFGTSRFLQAHFDLFAHEAREAGQNVAPIVIAKTSPSADRSDRLRAFNRNEGFRVLIRGLSQGTIIDRTIVVQSVHAGIDARQNWDTALEQLANTSEFIVSNTSDKGYLLSESDHKTSPFSGNHIPQSFPSMLGQLLWRRWRSTSRAITILPCELISRNGSTLKDIICSLAKDFQTPEKFFAWLNDEVIWADTLVDRIVSEALQPAGAVAEPYALWAIAKQPRLELPCTHPDIHLRDDLEIEERLKIHILNLSHTVLAEEWLRQDRDPGATVLEYISRPPLRSLVEDILLGEVLPTFQRLGQGKRAASYIQTTLDRLSNPFLRHKLADIAENHEIKKGKRIANFIGWSESVGATDFARLSKLLS